MVPFLISLRVKPWTNKCLWRFPDNLRVWSRDCLKALTYLVILRVEIISFAIVFIILNSPRPSPTPQPMQSGSGLKQPTTPPRPLTARTWAATVPTILSHKALIKLCTPVPVPCSVRHGPPVMVSPLERFLCCMHLKRHLTRCIQDELSTKVSNW